jgi:hypothetical protein
VSAIGSVFLVIYEVVAMIREGDEDKDLPNAIYPLCQAVFVFVARISHWPFLGFLMPSLILNEEGHWARVKMFTATHLVGWYM